MPNLETGDVSTGGLSPKTVAAIMAAENARRPVMKQYQVTVNGEVFQVDVVEVASTVARSVPVVPPNPPALPMPAGLGDNSAIRSPLPGTVTSVNVKVNQAVKAGDVLLVLEAMKMENDLTISRDGTVSAVHVKAGTAVKSGEVLISIE
ncbi:MAG: biotin/lipoyl-binding protein [Defluviitaleaceae bacterium]|nr:biotin/lipoyl-binding protein [Defluviitaleaceae bacterium]